MTTWTHFSHGKFGHFSGRLPEAPGQETAFALLPPYSPPQGFVALKATCKASA